MVKESEIKAEREYSTSEASSIMGVTNQTVLKYLKSKPKEIKGIKRGPKPKWYILGSEIIAWAKKNNLLEGEK